MIYGRPLMRMVNLTSAFYCFWFSLQYILQDRVSWVWLNAGGTLLQYTLQDRAPLMRVVIRTSGTSRLCPHCTRALLANIRMRIVASCHHYYPNVMILFGGYSCTMLIMTMQTLSSSWWANEGSQFPLLGLSKPFWEIGQVLIAGSLRRIEMVFRLGSAGAKPNGRPPYWYSSTMMMAGFGHHDALEHIVDLVGCPRVSNCWTLHYQWTIHGHHTDIHLLHC